MDESVQDLVNNIEDINRRSAITRAELMESVRVKYATLLSSGVHLLSMWPHLTDADVAALLEHNLGQLRQIMTLVKGRDAYEDTSK